MQLLFQALIDLLEEKKIVPLGDLRLHAFTELGEFREHVVSFLKLPTEVFDVLLEESKIKIFNCCSQEYYFSPENSSPSQKICQICERPLLNPYDWVGRLPSLYSPATGEKIIVSKNTFYIGRRTDCDFTLENIDMSRKHCCISLVDGRYKVIDLSSRNGTFLNQVKIKEAYIKSGDVIRFGKKIYLMVGHVNQDNAILDDMESSSSHMGDSSLTDMLIGVKLGSYVIQRNLGKGGTCVVYLAEDKKTQQPVAVKILRSSKQDEQNLVERFHKERVVLEKLRSNYIIQYFDAGNYNGLNYIVLEYFGKGSLGDYLRQHNRLPLYLSLKIIQKVLMALEVAHEISVIHRDIKPDNILIDSTFEVRVTDFGLMKNLEASKSADSTVSGVTLGTPSYMAPEQVKTAKAASFQTDIYGVAATLYHMLTGHPPYEGSNAIEIIMKVGVEPIVSIQDHRSDLPEEFCHVLHQALDFDPMRRYQSVTVFRELLEQFMK